MEFLTGLSVVRQEDLNSPFEIVESEPFQVGMYAPGGLYLPHFDVYDHDDIGMANEDSYTIRGEYVGDRIATLMFYVS